jgi:hypothetical protein
VGRWVDGPVSFKLILLVQCRLLWYACYELDTYMLELSSGRSAWSGVARWAMRRAQREARYETGEDVPVVLGDAKSFMYSKEGADAGMLPYSLLSTRSSPGGV